MTEQWPPEPGGGGEGGERKKDEGKHEQGPKQPQKGGVQTWARERKKTNPRQTGPDSKKERKKKLPKRPNVSKKSEVEQKANGPKTGQNHTINQQAQYQRERRKRRACGHSQKTSDSINRKMDNNHISPGQHDAGHSRKKYAKSRSGRGA